MLCVGEFGLLHPNSIFNGFETCFSLFLFLLLRSKVYIRVASSQRAVHDDDEIIWTIGVSELNT